MATAPKSKTSIAYLQLSKTLGAKPPKALDDLPAKNLQDLNEKVAASLAAHKDSIEEAENSIVQHAPRPLRGTVRKILGVGS